MTDDSNDDRSRAPRDGAEQASSRAAPRKEPQDRAAAEPAEDRIAKVIARAGIASRRDAEAMIAEGRVTLNGEVLASPAVNVSARDAITVDGEPLPARERTRLWIFHKPRGVVTTARDPEGRSTVFEILPEDLPRVVAIGRLDINTEGLLLLTNDGGLARVVAHPETGWMRRYRIRAYGDITQADLDRLKDGVTVDAMEYGPVEATLDRVQGDNLWITMGLREGKNREVKRILEHIGLRVNRLIRLSFGPFQLGDLEPGLVEEVKTKVLKEQLGTKLAEEAGVDFTSPVREPIAPFGSPKKSGAPVPRARPVGGDRPEGRFAERARFERPRGERPGGRVERGEGRGPSFGAGKPAERPARAERPRSVWRDDADPQARTGSKAPRRGADPREARAASAERPRERVRPIEVGEGRKVRVERLVSAPREEGPPRAPRTERPGRGPSGDDRPRRRDDRDFSGRPAHRASGDRPGGGGPGSDRPPRRSLNDDGPRRAGPGAGRGPGSGGGRGFGGPRDGERPRRAESAGPPRGRSAQERPSRDGERPGGGGFAGRGERPRAGGDRPRPGGDRPRPGGDRPRPGGDRPRPGGFGKRPGGPKKGPPRGRS